MLEVNLEEFLEHEEFEANNLRIDLQPSKIGYSDIKDDY